MGSGNAPSSTTASVTGKQPESILKSSQTAKGNSSSFFPAHQSTPKKVIFSDEKQDVPAESEEARRAKEEQERREREEEKRWKEEEILQRARAEAQRRQQEERERKAREEEERRRQEEERRRQEEEGRRQEEQERAARAAAAAEQARREEELRQQKNQAMEALTMSIFLDPAQGLLGQFIEQQIQELVPVVREEIWGEDAKRWAEERYQAKQKERIVRVLQRWVDIVRRKKRMGKARNRRKWLKENAERLAAASTGNTPGPASPVLEPAPLRKGKEKVKDESTFKKPAAPASASRKEPAATSLIGRKRKTNRPVAEITANGGSSKNAVPEARKAPSSTDEAPMAFYRNPAAPIDRTQTDYFKLRAQGLDPNKILKRGLDSSTSHDDYGNGEQRKRARTSMDDSPGARPASRASFSHSTSRPTLVDRVSKDEGSIMDRFRAVKESLSKSFSGRERERSASISRQMPVPQHHRSGSMASSVRGAASPPSSANNVIAKARALLGAKMTAPQRGSPAPGLSGLRHSEFSHSVPDLHASYNSYNSLGASQFGQSRISFVGSPAPDRSVAANKPAYWARQSAFVPKHLYGKGPEAVKQYFESSRGARQGSGSVSAAFRGGMSPASAAKPLELSSSPIPTQASYFPTQTQGQVQTQTQTQMPMRESQPQSQFVANGNGNGNMAAPGKANEEILHLDEDGNSDMEGYSHHNPIGNHGNFEEAVYEDDVAEEIEFEDGSVVDSGDEEGDDEDDEEDDEDSIDEDEEDDEDNMEEDEDEDEDEHGFDDMDFHNCNNGQQGPSQGPGATQDDAIELSD